MPACGDLTVSELTSKSRAGPTEAHLGDGVSMALPQAPSTDALTRAETTRVFERYARTRDPSDQETLVLQFLPLAHHCARRYQAGGEREDVEQVAALALVKAIDRYDPSRGIAFSSFAMPTILGEIKRYFRDHGWSVHVPRSLQELRRTVDEVTEELTGWLGRSPTIDEIAERCDTTAEAVLEARMLGTAHHPESLDRPLADQEDGTLAGILGGVDPGFGAVEDLVDLDLLLSDLTPRERELLRLRFVEDLVQHEIAERLAISQMHVSRLIRQSLASIRAAHDSAAPGN
jgi:RNA polymerase sigma-B factor